MGKPNKNITLCVTTGINWFIVAEFEPVQTASHLRELLQTGNTSLGHTPRQTWGMPK